MSSNTFPGLPAVLEDDDPFEGLHDTTTGEIEDVPAPPVNRRVKKLRPRKPRTTPVLNKLATVPDIAYHTNYVPRSVAKIPYAVIFDHALNTASNVLMEGPTGSGKTTAVMAYAALNGMPFYSFSSSSASEPSQLFGKMLPTGDKVLEWFDGPVTDIFRYGGLLLINEFNFLPMRIASVLFSTLDVRRVLQLVDHHGEIVAAHRPGPNHDPSKKVSDCWCKLPYEDCKSRWVLIVADMNPDYEGTQRVNRAILNRFPIRLEWGYDADVEKTLIASEALQRFAWKVRTEDQGKNLGTPLSTNMLMEFERAIEGMASLEFAWVNLLAHFDRRDRLYVENMWKPFIGNIEQDYLQMGWIA